MKYDLSEGQGYFHRFTNRKSSQDLDLKVVSLGHKGKLF